MRKIFLSMALVTLIGAPAAFAQSGGSFHRRRRISGPPPAPVGHRQPRAGRCAQ